MTTRLNNFEPLFSDLILRRGNQYFADHRVLMMNEVDSCLFQAHVRGSEEYIVMVQLSPSDDGCADTASEIIDLKCSCPYEFERHCKHEAAVLYALSKRLQSGKERSDVRRLLSDLTREQLTEIIATHATGDKQFRLSLMHDHAPDKDVDPEGDARELIRDALEEEMDWDGFVSRSRAMAGGAGFWDANDEAERLLEGRRLRPAFLYARVILEEAVDALQYVDDSDGDLGVVVSTSLDFLGGFEGPDLGDDLRSEMVDYFLQQACSPRFDDWSDWMIDLISLAVDYATDQALELRVHQVLDESIASRDLTEWSGEYNAAQLWLAKATLLERHEHFKEAEEHLHGHREYPDIRRRLIERLWAAGAYADLIGLADEGLIHDDRYAGLIQEWRDWRVQALEQLGDTIALREATHELICDGEADYLSRWKATFAGDEWEVARDALVRRLGQTHEDRRTYHVLAELLRSEDLIEQLMDLAKEDPHRIIEHADLLAEPYPDPVVEAYRSTILRDSEYAGGRGLYRRLVNDLRQFGQVSGSAHAQDLAKEILTLYPRRSALRDEFHAAGLGLE